MAPAGLPASPGTPLARPSHWLRLPEGDMCQSRVRGRAEGGRGGFISAWHRVSALWQEREEQVAWDAGTCRKHASSRQERQGRLSGMSLLHAGPARQTLSPGHLCPASPHCALYLADSRTPSRLSPPRWVRHPLQALLIPCDLSYSACKMYCLVISLVNSPWPDDDLVKITDRSLCCVNPD